MKIRLKFTKIIVDRDRYGDPIKKGYIVFFRKGIFKKWELLTGSLTGCPIFYDESDPIGHALHDILSKKYEKT